MNDSTSNRSLFFVSFATLFVEIMLVRWIGTEVRVFAFFQNLALIACFLGFGLGCYHAASRGSVATSMVAIALLVAFVKLPLESWQVFLNDLSSLLGFSRNSVFWMPNRDLGVSPLLLTFISIGILAVFLLLLVIILKPLGQWVGHYLDCAGDPIRAYSVNLAGSLAGMLAFALLAFLWLPPAVWFTLAIGAMLVFRKPSKKTVAIAIASAVTVVVMLQADRIKDWKTTWSPYQKVVVRAMGRGEYYVEVNNSVYMAINNMTPEFFKGTSDASRLAASPYNSPLRFARKLDRVLVVGSGGGNDVAGALRAGAAHVDAVEIDPVILSIGRKLHPEKPYSSPRVRTIVNDARAVFRQSSDKYDAIIFGLLDSHTHFSGYSNMRIDNYVYTEESLRDARSLLAPGGILILKFEVRKPWTWMGDRFHSMLTRLFGRPPVTYHGPTVGRVTSATVFITSNDPDLWSRAAKGDLAKLVQANPPRFRAGAEGAWEPLRDDWPYVYNRFRSIPRTYINVSIVLLLLALVLVGKSFAPREPSTWRFFLLGAGFLLMETQMVSRLALYFGTTWIVSSIVISAILLVLVGANLFANRYRPRTLTLCYLMLVTSLFLIYLLPWGRLALDVRTVGALLAAAYCLPVFLAGIIFAETFRRETRKSSVLGANILGSVAGGLAQNLSFLFGIKALLLLAAAIYGLAALTEFRRSSTPSWVGRGEVFLRPAK